MEAPDKFRKYLQFWAGATEIPVKSIAENEKKEQRKALKEPMRLDKLQIACIINSTLCVCSTQLYFQSAADNGVRWHFFSLSKSVLM